MSMKFGFTPLLFVCAIVVGIALSFAFASFSSPHVVEQPVIVITPVPTPQPVYVQPTAVSSGWSGVEQNDSTSMILSFLPIAIIGVAAMSILLPILTMFSGRD